MTGFARARQALGPGEITVTVRSVNHRSLDLHLHLPLELEPLDGAVRAAVKRRVRRGHVEVEVRLSGLERAIPVAVNHRLLESYLEAFRSAAAAYGLTGQPDLNAALRIPGMFEAAEPEPNPEVETAALATLEQALGALDEFRCREAAEIVAEMRRWNQALKEAVARMEEIRSRAVPAFAARLSQRLADLLAGVPVDPQRLAQETAYLADRSDVSEELTRLRVHTAKLDDLLREGEEIGKKLDFLLQEMQRETNTILGKVAGAAELGLAITELALAAKSEIERIREQAGNLE